MRANIAASFQRIAVQHLAQRCSRAVSWVKEDSPALKHFVVAGGVAANAQVRSSLTEVAEEAGLELVCPPPLLCTDNGVMVAWAGLERYIINIHTQAKKAGRALMCISGFLYFSK